MGICLDGSFNFIGVIFQLAFMAIPLVEKTFEKMSGS